MTATGRESQYQATAIFTDANVKVQSDESGVTFDVTIDTYTSANCSGTPVTTTASINSAGTNFTVTTTGSAPIPRSRKFTAEATSDQGAPFDEWTSTSPTGITYTSPNLFICASADGPSYANSLTANYNAAPDLELIKSTSSTFVVGSNVTYTIEVSNSGTADAHSLGGPPSKIRVTDPVPTGLTFVSGGGANNWGACSLSSGDVICEFSPGQSIAPDGSTSFDIIFTLTTDACTAGITNAATVGNANEPAGNINGGNTGSAVTAVGDISGCAPPAAPDLSVSKTDNAASFYFPAGGPGENGTYEIVVTNNGDAATSSDFTVTDVLVAELDFVSGSGTNWSCAESPAQTVICTYSAVIEASGGTSTALTLTVKPTQLKGGASGNTVDNNASVVGGGDDTSADSNTESTPILGRPDLAITKAAVNAPFSYGVAESYTIDVENIGNAATTSTVTVTDPLPSQVTYTGFSGTNWSCVESPTNTVTCTYSGAALAAGGGDASQLTLNVEPNAVADDVDNTATVSQDDAETVTTNNSDTEQVDIAKAGTTTTLAQPDGTQYSDKVKLNATVTKTVSGSGDITGYVKFHITGPGGFSYNTPDPGIALDTDDKAEEYVQITGPGTPTYTVTAEYLGDDHFAGSTSTSKTLTVAKENAEGFTISNAGSAVTGVTSFTVVVGIKEALLGNGHEPDQNDGEMPGDISKVSLTAQGAAFTLAGVNLTGNCSNLGVFGGSGYSAFKKYSCVFTYVGGVIPVDVYTLTFTVGGDYFTGTYEDVFSIWDPAAGFATGGGWFLLANNDGGYDRTSFGFSFTQTKGKTSVRGGLVVIRHLAGGGVCRAKSNSMNSPSVVGNTATLAGKGNYNCVIGGVTTDSQGNINIIATAVDNGTSGIDQDQFRVKAWGQLDMSTLELLKGGNVQVPQPKSK